MPPWFLKTAVAVARFKEVPLDYVVLRPSESVCAARAAREARVRFPAARYRELYAVFDGTEPHIISDDVSNAATMVARVREELKTGSLLIA